MSKKKAYKHRRGLPAKVEVDQSGLADSEINVETNKAQSGLTPYDPVKHKGYVLLYKKHRKEPVWIPPAQVKGFKAAGWKTQKEVEEIYRKYIKKHPEAAQQQMDSAICPLCRGTRRVWTNCCDETGCGCAGKPVDNECDLCLGIGVLNVPLEMSDALIARRTEQVEIDKWMEANQPVTV